MAGGSEASERETAEASQAVSGVRGNKAGQRRHSEPSRAPHQPSHGWHRSRE